MNSTEYVLVRWNESSSLLCVLPVGVLLQMQEVFLRCQAEGFRRKLATCQLPHSMVIKTTFLPGCLVRVVIRPLIRPACSNLEATSFPCVVH